MSYLNPPYFNASFLGRLIVQRDFVIEEIKAILDTFLNHLNWIMRKAPVPTRQDCMALSLPMDESAIAEQRDEEMIEVVELLFAQTVITTSACWSRPDRRCPLLCSAKTQAIRIRYEGIGSDIGPGRV